MAARKTAKKSRTVKKAGAAGRGAKKAARKAARKAAAKTARKAPARKAAAKAPARKRKQIVGEGDYEASRAFLKDQAGFVQKNRARIPALGRKAKAALDGPEGAALRAAEAKARGHAAPDEDAAAEPGAFVIPPG